jgi:hypothetical protein
MLLSITRQSEVFATKALDICLSQRSPFNFPRNFIFDNYIRSDGLFSEFTVVVQSHVPRSVLSLWKTWNFKSWVNFAKCPFSKNCQKLCASKTSVKSWPNSSWRTIFLPNYSNLGFKDNLDTKLWLEFEAILERIFGRNCFEFKKSSREKNISFSKLKLSFL